MNDAFLWNLDATWIQMNMLSVDHMPEFGNFTAAYVLRHIETKEILYVGSTKSVLRRLLANYLGGVGGATTQRIHGYLFGDGYIQKVEVAWFQSQEYQRLEEELKKHYRGETGRKLPPWNRL